MNSDQVFNTLLILLEVVLFTGIVGIALAVRRRRLRNTPDAPAAPAAPASVPDDLLAERRRAVIGALGGMLFVAAAMLAGVAVFVLRHHRG